MFFFLAINVNLCHLLYTVQSRSKRLLRKIFPKFLFVDQKICQLSKIGTSLCHKDGMCCLATSPVKIVGLEDGIYSDYVVSLGGDVKPSPHTEITCSKGTLRTHITV